VDNPLPLFPASQCEDVDVDCNGMGRVVIEARLMEPSEIKALVDLKNFS